MNRPASVFVAGLLVAVTLPLSMPSCGRSEAVVEFYLAQGYRFSTEDRSVIERVAEESAAEARQLLPALPHGVVLRVEAGDDVIPETGEAAVFFQPNVVRWDVDPWRPGGVRAIAERALRGSLFHQFHHLVRGQSHRDHTFIDTIVSEGLATAFERDFAKSAPPWSVYADDVKDWIPEVLALPDDTSWNEWLKRDPSRRWAGQQVGTYLADTAGRATGQNAAQMVTMPTEEVIRLALGEPAP